MNKYLNNISETAYLVAGCRAIESFQPNPLFKDHQSALFLKGKAKKIFTHFTKDKRFPLFYASIVVRTKIIDRLILKLIKKNKIQQVINLGSGLDTRPYRMNLPKSFIWWEIDLKHILAYKSNVLTSFSPNCKLLRKNIDLNDIDLIKDFLLHDINHKKNTAVLMEGLLVYLDKSNVFKILKQFSSLECCTHLIADIATSENKNNMENYKASIFSEILKYMQFFSVPNDPIFKDSAWILKSSRDTILEAIKQGRPLSSNKNKSPKEILLEEIKSYKWRNLSYVLLFKNKNCVTT